jgi:hypothetical protein
MQIMLPWRNWGIRIITHNKAGEGALDDTNAITYQLRLVSLVCRILLSLLISPALFFILLLGKI